MKSTEIIVATGNPHKVEEIRAILAVHGFRVLSLTDVGAGEIPEPEEDGDTFAYNARIKATQYARAINRMVLADDSGLAVDALGPIGDLLGLGVRTLRDGTVLVVAHLLRLPDLGERRMCDDPDRHLLPPLPIGHGHPLG